MTRVKICGISRLEDAAAANEAGADFIGLVFAKSPRRVTVEQARSLIKSLRAHAETAKVVGLFANSNLTEVNETARTLELDFVQLSGDESDDYVRQIEAPVIRAIHLQADEASEANASEVVARAKALLGMGATPLLDAKVDERYGGTGRGFDHAIARAVAAEHDFLLAGGLTPGNVAEAARFVRPWGVDVSSGVETDGAKDKAKIRAFISAVRTVDASRPDASPL